jgi:hypothetical protein
MVLLSLYLFWKAYTARTRCPACNTMHSIAGWLAFLAASAVTFYAKGLVGPGLVWVSVGVFLVYRREWKLIVLLGMAFSVVFALVLTPWVVALWHAGGRAFLYSVFWENQFGRFLAFNDPNLPLDPYYVHKEGALYYLASLPVRLLPWTLLVMAALISWFRPKSPVTGLPAMFIRFALVCMLALLHVSSSKTACYALPLFPILFLMTGVWLEDTATRWISALDRCMIGLTFCLVGVAALAVPLGYVLAFLVGLTVVWTPGIIATLPVLDYVRVFLAFVSAPGTGTAITCFGLALMTLLVGGYTEFRLWKAFRSGQPACNAGSVATAGRRVDAILSAPMILAVLGLLDAAIFMPAVNYQRTYEPLADLVRQELNSGMRIALAGERERDLGALMFYLDSRLPVVASTPTSRGVGATECADFLYDRPGPAGIIVAESDLIHVQRLLIGKPFRIIQPMHGGHKSAEFRLLVNCEPDKVGGALRTVTVSERNHP